jgi:hypothetical protein
VNEKLASEQGTAMKFASIFEKLRELAPYAAIELVLPGGSIMALLLWLYRRQKKGRAFATQEILSLL